MSWHGLPTISLFLALYDFNVVIDATFSQFGPSEDYLHRHRDVPRNWVIIYGCTVPISGDEPKGLAKHTFMLFGAGSHAVQCADGTTIQSEGLEAMRSPVDIFATSINYAGFCPLRNFDAILFRLNSMYDECYYPPAHPLDLLPVDVPRVLFKIHMMSDFENAALPNIENGDDPDNSADLGPVRAAEIEPSERQSDAVSEASSMTMRGMSPIISENPEKLHRLWVGRKENTGNVPMQRKDTQSRHPHLVPSRSAGCGVTKRRREPRRAIAF
ncbi:hypothetical protein [Agrobacterium larrymoorei]|nr:hypothetical protein [Agrobacterium larrymoorei]